MAAPSGLTRFTTPLCVEPLPNRRGRLFRFTTAAGAVARQSTSFVWIVTLRITVGLSGRGEPVASVAGLLYESRPGPSSLCRRP